MLSCFDKFFEGRPVEIKRTFTIGGKLYCVVCEKYTRAERTVLANQLKDTPEKSSVILVTKGSEINGYDYPSVDFDRFVERNGLDEIAIQQCIDGKQLTHKGFKFKLDFQVNVLTKH